MRRFWIILPITTLLSFLTRVDSFIPTVIPRCTFSGVTSLFATNNKSKQDEKWVLKNDFRTFLNQCTIQSFLYLLYDMKDLQTVNWVEEFVQPTISWRTSELAADPKNYVSGEFLEPSEEQQKQTSQLLRYHGLGAINMTLFPEWECFFLDLLKMEKEGWTVASTKPHIPEYEFEINPSSLCSRLISVREQISKEWVKDLEVIASMSKTYMESYWKSQRTLDEVGSTEGAVKIGNLLFLEWDPNQESDYAPSPLRKGNFDLLTLMTTQEAVHRILNDENYWDGAAAASNLFLDNFYSDRKASHFSGVQRYSRSDDFLNELLATAPSTINISEEMNSLIDPSHLAELILRTREKVALEWREVTLIYPKEHVGIRKEMLNKLIQAY